MKQYLEGLQQVLDAGVDRVGRNGKTRALFGMQMRYNLEDGFPAVTTKKLAFRSVKAELLGFLRGYDHAEQFEKLGTQIWNANADAWDVMGTSDGYMVFSGESGEQKRERLISSAGSLNKFR